jgi:outer membrane protein assembly factor BamB
MDRFTGEHRFEHALDRLGEVELAVLGDRIYATTGKTLYCFEYPTGVLLGTAAIPGKYPGRPTLLLDNGLVIVATRGEVSCFDDKGQLLWFDPLPDRGVGSVALGFPDNVRQADDQGSR